MRGALLVSGCFLLLVFAGCVGGGATPEGVGGGPNVEIDKDDPVIRGIVIDDELIPIEAATVKDSVSGFEVVTSSDGTFTIGPLAEGEHVLTAEKAGYQSVQQVVQVFDAPVDGVRILLSAVASTVPYHETTNHVTFVNCASYNPIGGVPCTKLVDYVAGTSLSPEESFAFTFTVPAPNLVDLLVEMVWSQQAFASDMLFKVQTPPGQPATALSTRYFSMEGGRPLRGWIVAGVSNTGEDGPVFDAEPNKITYEGMTIWSDNNATIPGVPGVLSGWTFYFNHRTETWMTFFYNREGSREFTALPDE